MSPSTKTFSPIVEGFVLKGDVDLKVGNINFNGFVEVKGDGLDVFKIKATKGISVSGSVGACKLESEGPVAIGSMADMSFGLIRCKGNLTARYLNHVTVEFWEDVHIANEIRNFTIKATGSINALISIKEGVTINLGEPSEEVKENQWTGFDH